MSKSPRIKTVGGYHRLERAENDPRCNYFWAKERTRGGRVVATASGCARTVRQVAKAVPKSGLVIVYGRDSTQRTLPRGQRLFVEHFYFRDGKRQRF